MSFIRIIEKSFKRFIPSPFSLAVLLSLFILVLAFLTTGQQDAASAVFILKAWQNGMWDPSLLVFMVQMMLILVLGHILVLSKPVAWLMQRLTGIVRNNLQAVVLVTCSTMLVAFFNWGLGLIFGAIMARKVAETAQQKQFPVNYPLLGAAGYVGLMVWHGGMSGSAPLKVAETGHLASLFPKASTDFIAQLPSHIPTTHTIFSSWNLSLFAILLVILPICLGLLTRKGTLAIPKFTASTAKDNHKTPTGADRLDHSPWLGVGFGILLLVAFFARYGTAFFKAQLTPNMLNFLMLGLCVLLHRSFYSFLQALQEAIGGAAAILIQFPLYFGVMNVMRETGLVGDISTFFVSISTETTLPIFSFFSAGLVNIFVPSGGGQWAVQGPVILESATELGVPLEKMVMALAYGDQITNMLQPFWALPLLAITRLKAREILPYTLIMMLIGSAIYLLGLLLINP